MRVLITGASGFVGSHLAEYILSEHSDCEVFGVKRWRSARSNYLPDIQWFECDLTDDSGIRKAIKYVQPDKIFHLAAQSHVDYSFDNPKQTLQDNIIGSLNLFEAVRYACNGTPIILASTSEVYGQVFENETPIGEHNPMRPANPYAVSKCCVDLLAYQYNVCYNMNIIRVRGFTQTGPRQSPKFFLASFASQIAEIEKGKIDCLEHGNLDSTRTILDVRDMVRAYWTISDRGSCENIYLVGGDTTKLVGEILKDLIGLAKVSIKTRLSFLRLRPADVTLQIPDSSRVRAMGWSPQIPYIKTISDTLEYCRGIV